MSAGTRGATKSYYIETLVAAVKTTPKIGLSFPREIYLETEVFSWSILFILFTLRLLKVFL